MEALARQQPGFLGIESARGADGLGITVSYWATFDDVAAWGRHAEHLLAQKLGREEWYKWFALRVCRVERAAEFTRPADAPE
jgi:heme-degrading monooxygenase HmoA